MVYKKPWGDKEHGRFLHPQLFPFLGGWFLLLAASHPLLARVYGMDSILTHPWVWLQLPAGAWQSSQLHKEEPRARIFWVLWCHHRGFSGPTTSLVFEFVIQNIVKSFQSTQPVQHGNISQMLKENIATGKVRPKQSRVQRIMVFVVQGPGSFPMLHSRASLTLEVPLSDLKIWLFP